MLPLPGFLCRRWRTIAMITTFSTFTTFATLLTVRMYVVKPGQATTFSVGTEEGRAERQANQWSYIVGGNEATVYSKRKHTLLSSCSRLNKTQYPGISSEKSVRGHFVVDQNRKIVYCGIEKVGCTFWKRVLQITTGVKKAKSPYDIPGPAAHDMSLLTFRPMAFDRILDVVRTSSKFIFVREPYSRIFSGFIDKIFSPNVAYFAMRRRIVQEVRSAEQAVVAGSAPIVSFREFVKYVVLTLKTGRAVDGHFMPMFDHCRPCALQYDIVGKMESFATDAKYVLTALNLNSVVQVNFTQQDTDTDAIVDTLGNLYRDREVIEKSFPFSQAVKYVWRKLQIRGVLAKSSNIPESFLANAVLPQDEITAFMLSANKNSDRGQRREQRKEALVEALYTVDPGDLDEYRRLFRPDFDLFGYDIEPKELFVDEPPAGFSYLNV